MKKYVIFKYITSNKREVIYSSNNYKKIIKIWEEKFPYKDYTGLTIHYCKELNYFILNGHEVENNIHYELQTPEYYNTEEWNKL